MRNYEAIQYHIERAHLQRSVYLAELIAEAITSFWNGIGHAAEVLFAAARAKTRNNVFTFDA